MSAWAISAALGAGRFSLSDTTKLEADKFRGVTACQPSASSTDPDAEAEADGDRKPSRTGF